MLYLAFDPMLGPISFKRSSLRLLCGNMSPHKIKVYSMVKMDIDVRVASGTVYTMEVLPPKGQPFLKGNTSLWVSYLSLGREGYCLIASFDSSLP
ncbi:hypothetical protein Goshw_024383 [Gossypium schwendimanii]|uniref:Uncharacterized protein n=1 Tax=Gossypium schwendimanii TaxID=34291 RepID=A0A7J9L6E9_GOSSC|nr:hypothetical protein [Gossypium schwendimanii]